MGYRVDRVAEKQHSTAQQRCAAELVMQMCSSLAQRGTQQSSMQSTCLVQVLLVDMEHANLDNLLRRLEREFDLLAAEATTETAHSKDACLGHCLFMAAAWCRW